MIETIGYSRPNFKSHLRAMFAIARRDWRQYWRYPINAIFSPLAPIIWLAPVYFMGKAFSVNGQALGFAGYAGTTDYMSFILIGTFLSSFIGAVFWGMGYALKEDMDAGVLESNWLAPIPRPLLLIGHSLTNMTVTAITSLATLVVAGLVFGFRPTGNTLAAVLTILPVLIGLYGFGFAFSALVLVMKDANTLVDVGNFSIQLLSGSDFPVTVLPGWLIPLALALPLTYGYDAVRGWLLKTTTLFPIQWEIALLCICMVAMIAFGLAMFQVLERYVRRRGTLGTH